MRTRAWEGGCASLNSHLLSGAVNATWPHEKHIWVNYGLGGQSLCVTAEAQCNQQPPAHVDLVVLDATAVPCRGNNHKSIESLIRRLIRSSEW